MRYLFSLILVSLFLSSCSNENVDTKSVLDTVKKEASNLTNFDWQVDRFADIRVLRYQVPGFDKLSLRQKKFVYYLSEAGMCGRDIMYDMNYRHNLKIRRAFESIIANYKGNKNSDEWKGLTTYAKQMWFANGIHHHYSMNKFKPSFGKEFFLEALNTTNTKLDEKAINVIFNAELDSKKVSLDSEKDLVQNSAVNFYGPNVTQKDAEDYYNNMIDKSDSEPISYGLNTKLVKENGKVLEKIYHANGMYGSAIKEMNKWLTKAMDVTENDKQKRALQFLIEYYQTGDLKKWDEYNILWSSTKSGDIDYITGFVEVYNDPLGYKGSYETIVQIKDFEASDRMQVLANNVQWFEDNSTILDKHKKKNVVGVSYNVVNVAAESGDASPATPIGVNLPNANWIRAKHGSKSVSLGNIVNAYSKASGPGMLTEFAHDEEEIARVKKYGELADKLATALHEVIGHASGQIEPGVGTPKQTMKSYASTIEEARADIVALYYLLDPKLIELGLIPSLEAGKAEYDSFIRNGMLQQLRRLEMGEQVEESHMRNRQLICKWVFERGAKDNVISEVNRDGKTYYNINDYEKLRTLFGELLTELQRMTSAGDYTAAKAIVEDYGVKVDPKIHQQVLDRAAKLNIAPYSGFVNPELVEVKNSAGEITDIKIEYPNDFVAQMLKYGKKYSFLPDDN